MELTSPLKSLQLIKVGVNKDLHKAYSNLNILMQKVICRLIIVTKTKFR